MKSHSEISGSKPTCGSPERFVACHILHQHLEPSHPPNSVRSLLHVCVVSSIWIVTHILYSEKYFFKVRKNTVLSIPFVQDWLILELLLNVWILNENGLVGKFTADNSRAVLNPRPPPYLLKAMQGRCSTRLSYEPNEKWTWKWAC